MAELIPSILVHSSEEFERRLRLVEHDCRTVHVDILDGSLFPDTSWFDAKAVGAMQTPVSYEIHLMVENPLPIIEAWKREVPGLKRAIVHAEMSRQTGTIIEHIHDQLEVEAGVALNPETPLEEIHKVLPSVDQLTVMSIHPGRSDQTFLGDSVLEKIREIHRLHPDLPIEIDGGVRPELIGPLLKAGSSRFCASHMIFSTADPTATLRTMHASLSTLP